MNDRTVIGQRSITAKNKAKFSLKPLSAWLMIIAFAVVSVTLSVGGAGKILNLFFQLVL